MAEEEEAGDQDRPSWKERMPEAGVGFFGTFLLAMAIGFLLALAGQLMLSMIVFAVAVVSILATLLTPSPSAKARRAGVHVTPSEEEMEEEEEEERPDLLVETEAAPTRSRRDAPAPPPEPPPLEDIVVEAGEGNEAPAPDDDEVWVE